MDFHGVYFLPKEHKLPVVVFPKYVIRHHIRNTFVELFLEDFV